jgi:hypothetical protein
LEGPRKLESTWDRMSYRPAREILEGLGMGKTIVQEQEKVHRPGRREN